MPCNWSEPHRRHPLAALQSRSSNYVISVSQEDTGRKSVHYFGKIRSNFVGTEFTVYDKGSKPGARSCARPPEALSADSRDVVHMSCALGWLSRLAAAL